MIRGLCASLLLVAASAGAAPFSDADLDALLARSPATGRPVDSIIELIPLLPDELRENFTFVYQSRSPFAADITEDHPRVILFSEDATFIATFVTRGAGRDLLETLSFDRARSAFTPHARALPAARRSGADPERLEASCARCHGADSRPIFDSYPSWPGFYGSTQDTFPRELPSARRERAAYLRFLGTTAHTKPYRDLRWVLGSPVSPYTDPARYHPEQLSEPDDTLVYQPNTRLGMALSELNRKRLFRKLSTAPGFASAAPRWLADLIGCKDPAGGLEGEEAFGAAARMENAARLSRLGIDPRRSVAERYQMQERDEQRNLARIGRLAVQAGVSREDWSLALEPYSVSYYDGILASSSEGARYYLIEDFIYELLAHLAVSRPELKAHFRPAAAFSDLGYPFGTKLDLRDITSICPSL